ncbi:glycoside hydrolase family 125 protein [Alloacidobacterium dinghuense]|uniref:glycoside hydrolase family 125 protein n=1 Tax=Alloacidobacterium dinghuense TaxID=2763107 RepID=UPI002036F579
MRSAGSAAIATAIQSALPSPLFAVSDSQEESKRPKPADRRFRSAAVEAFIDETRTRIGDSELAVMFANCFPNTLDTTVEPGQFEGKPDTPVITGDIPAMWLRDSSAQVWPYLPLARKDEPLRALLEGVIRRQARCILIDPYANAFMADLNAPSLEWSRKDKTDLKQGVGERKWELDSLCYPIRLSHGYWKQTGDTRPFDAGWQQAMALTVETMIVQQRKHGLGPYRFQRESFVSTETLPADGYGNPVKPVGLIASGFRPSDDACIFPFLVPSNLFSVTSLRQLAEMANAVLHDSALANQAQGLAFEVEAALRQHAIAQTQDGTIWAYEVDGFGSQLLMDDANVPSLLGLPYIASSPDAALYERTRKFAWSEENPWFFRGTAGEGIGGPHEGKDMIWPMSQTIYALTSNSDAEIRQALSMIKVSSAGSGFIHESYFKDDPKKFTRSWFAWANTLFGELIATLAVTKPALLG